MGTVQHHDSDSGIVFDSDLGALVTARCAGATECALAGTVLALVWLCIREQYQFDAGVHWATVSNGSVWEVVCNMLYDCQFRMSHRSANCGCSS